MSLPFKCICIFDGDRPESVPSSSWVKKGNTYTVIEICRMRMQGNILGFKLEEVSLTPYFPYQFFAASRFGIPIENETIVEEYLEKLLKEGKEELKEELVEVAPSNL